MCGVLQQLPGLLTQPEHLMKYNRHVTNESAAISLHSIVDTQLVSFTLLLKLRCTFDNFAIPTSRATQYLTSFQLLNNK